MSVWLHIGKLFLSDMENLTLNLLYINRLQPMTVSGNPILCVCVCVLGNLFMQTYKNVHIDRTFV